MERGGGCGIGLKKLPRDGGCASGFPCSLERRLNELRLVSWKESEGLKRRRGLEIAGYEVVYEAVDPSQLLAALRDEPPRALVIDLDRRPAMGRDLGVAVRVRARTRSIPLIFLGGSPEKVETVRRVLPDAGFGSWNDPGTPIEAALVSPPADPAVPSSALAGYSGTPLPKKLGIRPGARVLLAGAPDDFPETLGPLPDEVSLTRRFSSSVDLILWFPRSRSDLEKRMELWRDRTPSGGIWIVWPKKSSGVATDLDQTAVRGTGLNAGLVDYKIAAIDATWSGLKFAVRVKD